MQHTRTRWLLTMVGMLVLALAGSATPAAAIAPGTDPFQGTWARTDQPVASGAISRTWMWGPSGFSSAMYEPYTESPGGYRVVQYYDKTRMEITHPDAVNDGVWYVSNGLLAKELVTGRIQMGDNDFVQDLPAQVNVAGDSNDANGPTYASFSGLLTVNLGDPSAVITARIHRDGSLADEPGLAGYGVTAPQYVIETNHRIAAPFWDFMNSQALVYQDGQNVNQSLFPNPYYATGFPITEPYWARVQVAGTVKDVLVQVFERRVLTYTPDNAPEWRVEMGNVGQHYYAWRYNTAIPSEPAAPTAGADDMGPAPLVNWPVDHSGQSLVEISNQSPYPLTITFEGPVTQTFTVDACPDCIEYTSSAAFTNCRDDIPYRDVTLPPGNYKVSTEHGGSNVTPGSGPWTIVPNGEYGECIYVVQQRAPTSEAPTRAADTHGEATLPR